MSPVSRSGKWLRKCNRCGENYWVPAGSQRAHDYNDCPGNFEDIHKAGAERHPHSWFRANQTAVSAATGCGLDASENRTKIAVSLIVLRVLDAVKAP